MGCSDLIRQLRSLSKSTARLLFFFPPHQTTPLGICNPCNEFHNFARSLSSLLLISSIVLHISTAGVCSGHVNCSAVGLSFFCSWPEMQDMFHSVSVIANVFVIRATKTLSVMYLTVVVGRTCPVFPSCLARYLIISGVNCMTSCRCSRATAWPMTCCIAPRFSECAVSCCTPIGVAAHNVCKKSASSTSQDRNCLSTDCVSNGNNLCSGSFCARSHARILHIHRPSITTMM